MKRRRFFLDEKVSPGETILLRDPERRHILQVLRLKVGDAIELFRNDGSRYTGCIAECGKESLAVRIIEVLREDAPPLIRITLLQGIPKPAKMDLIVQKCVELGVSAIIPLIAKRTQYRPTEMRAARWQRIAVESCKQSGRSIVPDIATPQDFNAFVPGVSGGKKLLLDPTHTGKSLKEAVRGSKGEPVWILIGPEGGLDIEESELAIGSGFLPVSLGERILRTETAAIAAAAILQYELGDMARK
jgi:16S rRNA (uracil1498-N3)-methyltransferase